MGINDSYDVNTTCVGMTDLLLRFTPETTIRGITTVDESGQSAFSVYDFIDMLGRPCFRKKKRGGFSKRIWKRLIWKYAHHTKEIKNWSFEAPLRISEKVNRKFQSPVMTVCGLQKLWDLLRELFYAKFLEDPKVGVRNAGYALNVVKVTLERYMTGDHSMIEEIQTKATRRKVGAKRPIEHTVDSEAETPTKRKRTSPDMHDLLLELPGGMTVRGMVAPHAPAQMFWDSEAPGEVFSVYDFIDGIVRQMSSVPTYANISRVIWKRLSMDAMDGQEFRRRDAAELRHLSMEAPIRHSLQSSRRSPTPVMGMRGLYRLFLLINSDFKESGASSGPTHTRGRKVFWRELDKGLCSGLYVMFKKYHDGDHSMIRSARHDSIMC